MQLYQSLQLAMELISVHFGETILSKLNLKLIFVFFRCRRLRAQQRGRIAGNTTTKFVNGRRFTTNHKVEVTAALVSVFSRDR